MHDYRHLTVDPLTAGVSTRHLGAPPAPFTVDEPGPEPLAPVGPPGELVALVPHDRLAVVEAYRQVGWPQAVPGAHLRAEVADRLQHASAALPPRFGLAVFDAWRPLDLQQALYDEAYGHPGLPPGFVAPPDPDPRRPPPHLTGGAVDLTLSFDGRALGLGTGFDDFTPAAHAAALETTPGIDRDLRRLLVEVMHDAGFVVLDTEWWHFEHGTRHWAARTGCTPRYGPATLPH